MMFAMSDFPCYSCDPLYKFIENFLVRLVEDKVRSTTTTVIPSSGTHHYQIYHRPSSKVPDENNSTSTVNHGGNVQPSPTADPDLNLTAFVQKVVRCYATNIFRPANKEEDVTILFNWQFFQDLQHAWNALVAEDGRFPAIDLTDSYLKWPNILSDISIIWAHEAKDKYKTLEIYVSVPSVAKSIISWISRNFPRRHLGEQTCRIDTHSVSIGTTEFKGPAGKMPLTQYRKFLAAKFVALALAKCGCDVDTKKFYALPEQAEFEHSVFVVAQSLRESKVARRVIMGGVKVKRGDQLDVNDDMTVEYIHNLRLQGLKSCRLVEGSMGKDDTGMDLSWAISVANLSTATVNFDLLTKRPTASIEVAASNFSDEKISSNAGVLFIMYNYARIVSVLNKFSEMVNRNEYPTLPDIGDVDFDLLTSKEEAGLITVAWEWPRILDRSVDPVLGEFDIPSCLKYAKELAVRFNTFYTSSMVLSQPNAPHNFPKMFARIYLLRTCRAIIEEMLDLMQIDYNPTNCDNFEVDAVTPEN